MYVKQFITNIKNVKKKDTNTILDDSTKGALVGAGIGGGIGLVIGLVKRKNILLSVFIGSIVGAGISRVIKKKRIS